MSLSSDTANSSAESVSELRNADVIVIGAGLSGIGAGYHLQAECPDRSYLILEARSTLGGTWDLFRYPGIRSDSDMYTMGYEFKPWTEETAISSGPLILDYLTETASEYGIAERIHYNRRMTSAAWSSNERQWTLTVEVTDGSDDSGGAAVSTETYTCSFLFMCSGYYSYKGGYRPDFEGEESFDGQIIHPQEWPNDLDYRNKKVAIIGSGATAMTLVPAMAADAAHVTMVQRSPTFVVSRPSISPIARVLSKVLPETTVARFMRWRAIKLGAAFYRMTRNKPDKARKMLMKGIRQGMPDVDVDTHFSPTYNPWDQRLCLIPDGDLFKAINSGAASVVTDTIDRFTPNGIRMSSGETVEADIIITATGLQLVTLGEADFVVDGNPVDFSQSWTYKGLAYSDIPNMASVFGYVNASWTLRSDMITKYFCRLLNHMAAMGADVVVPRLRPSDADMERRPYIDDFSAGYMQRVMPLLPKQGEREPWLNTQSYQRDLDFIDGAEIADDVLVFERKSAMATQAG